MHYNPNLTRGITKVPFGQVMLYSLPATTFLKTPSRSQLVTLKLALTRVSIGVGEARAPLVNLELPVRHLSANVLR